MPGFSIGGSGAATDNGPVSTYDAKRKYRWLFSLDDQEGGGAVSGGSGLASAFLYLKEARRPSWNTEPIDQHHNQEKIWHIGKTSWEDIELKWYDMEQPDCSEVIYQWMNNQVNHIMNATPTKPSQYKKRTRLDLLDNAGDEIETWLIYNSWPYKVDSDTLDYGANDLLMWTCTLKYDRAEMTLGQ